MPRRDHIQPRPGPRANLLVAEGMCAMQCLARVVRTTRATRDPEPVRAVRTRQSYGHRVEAVGSRRRNLPAPPHVVFEDLCDPSPRAVRPWLLLLDDEMAPTIVESRRPDKVVWSSLWVKRPDARVQFDLEDGGGGTDLRWTLFVDEPVPDQSLTGHLRKRMNELINANLRYTYGQ